MQGAWAVIRDFFVEYGPDMLHQTGEHAKLVVVAVCVAIAISVPTGILLARIRVKAVGSVVLGAAGIIQTIPSLALVAYAVLLFIAVKAATGLGVPLLGKFPAYLALVLYALLPILRNTYTGIQQVDPAVIEVARGMGMTGAQVLFRVELPLALPVIMAGIRIATVWTIGIAALAGLIGAGGLGVLIFTGLRSVKVGYLVAGTLPATAMAILAEKLLTLVERWLTPTAAREAAQTAA